MAKAKDATKYKPHEFADYFPMMTQIEVEALAADIKANGLQHPIIIYEGQILDGRNRLAACGIAGVEPTFIEFDDIGDDAALARVISLNVQRRDLTAGQRAIVAAKTWMASGDTKDKGKGPRRGKDFTSLNDIAAQFKTSKPSVQQARDLLTEAPDLAGQVAAGALYLAKACEELQTRRKEAKQREKDLAKVSEFREAISSGEMSIEEAIQMAVEQERELQAVEASQADARSKTLSTIAEFVGWIDMYSGRDDEDIAWYGEPDSPGMYEHGLDTEQVSNAADLLQRFAILAFPKEATRGKKRK